MLEETRNSDSYVKSSPIEVLATNSNVKKHSTGQANLKSESDPANWLLASDLTIKEQISQFGKIPSAPQQHSSMTSPGASFLGLLWDHLMPNFQDSTLVPQA